MKGTIAMRAIAITAAALVALAGAAQAQPREGRAQGMRAQPVAMVVDAQAARRDARQVTRRAPRDITGLGRPVGRPYQP